MTKPTRRAILRDGSAAIGAAALLSNLPELARAETESASVFHVFAFQWKQGTSEAQKERAAKDIAAFQGVIPGLLQTHVGPNISPRGKRLYVWRSHAIQGQSIPRRLRPTSGTSIAAVMARAADRRHRTGSSCISPVHQPRRCALSSPNVQQQ